MPETPSSFVRPLRFHFVNSPSREQRSWPSSRPVCSRLSSEPAGSRGRATPGSVSMSRSSSGSRPLIFLTPRPAPAARSSLASSVAPRLQPPAHRGPRARCRLRVLCLKPGMGADSGDGCIRAGRPTCIPAFVRRFICALVHPPHSALCRAVVASEWEEDEDGELLRRR
ncbi:hypothetical protein B0H14DRAFT_1185148 [Mycena olivaceomarginata]|nr:hypothetical protein B0H14DRAFT_1185148 [Mycena olivaceomarginata]